MAIEHIRFERGLAQKIDNFLDSRLLIWGIISFGIILRLEQYLANRSLWLDEARIALNIVNRSLAQLIQPLDYDQGAPLGFLLVEKLVTQVGSNNEYTLRLFPLLAGIGSLFLFYKVASYYTQTKAVPISLGIFVISRYLVDYSTEVKQYSSDVAISLILVLVTVYIQTKKLTWHNMVLLSLVGAVALWFSHPALFILMGLGATLAIFSLIRKDWAKIGWLCSAYLLWGVSFVALYFFSLRHLSHNQVLLDYWQGSFMPLPPTSSAGLYWLLSTFFDVFMNPGGLTAVGLASFTFVAGGMSSFKASKEKFFFLIAPILLTLLASGFHLYPFKGRLLLFIVPVLLLFIAEGVEQIWSMTQPHSALIGLALAGLLLVQPLQLTLHNLIHPPTKEEIKPVISYVRTHTQPGDVLYLYYGAHEAFKYYQSSYGYQDQDYIVGVDSNNWADYSHDLDKLRGHNRVWVLFSHLSAKVDEARFFLYYLDHIGKRIDVFKSNGAEVYLYDLSSEKPESLIKAE